MEIKVGTPLLDLEGNALKHPETQQPWTVGLVLTTVALSAPAPGQAYNEMEQTARYLAAMDIRDAQRLVIDGMPDSTVEISNEMLGKLKADIMRMFGPIIAGQMAALLSTRRRPNIEVIEADRPN